MVVKAAVVVAAVRLGVVLLLGVVVDGSIQSDNLPPEALALLVAMVAVFVVAGAVHGGGGSVGGVGDVVVVVAGGCEDCGCGC